MHSKKKTKTTKKKQERKRANDKKDDCGREMCSDGTARHRHRATNGANETSMSMTYANRFAVVAEM